MKSVEHKGTTGVDALVRAPLRYGLSLSQ